ncbi:MAG: hypothetical protein AB7O68_08595 [Pirellulales bacterium]
MNRRNLVAVGVLGLGLSLAVGPMADRVRAGNCCFRCGCHDNCCKVCRPVPDVKEFKEVCWDVKCEDFCVPGPSCCCGKVEKHDDCGCWSYKIWKPNCGHIRTRRTLVKNEVTRKVPTTKWVVEDVCARCKSTCDVELPADGMPPALHGEQPPVIEAPVVPQDVPMPGAHDPPPASTPDGASLRRGYGAPVLRAAHAQPVHGAAWPSPARPLPQPQILQQPVAGGYPTVGPTSFAAPSPLPGLQP